MQPGFCDVAGLCCFVRGARLTRSATQRSLMITTSPMATMAVRRLAKLPRPVSSPLRLAVRLSPIRTCPNALSLAYRSPRSTRTGGTGVMKQATRTTPDFKIANDGSLDGSYSMGFLAQTAENMHWRSVGSTAPGHFIGRELLTKQCWGEVFTASTAHG